MILIFSQATHEPTTEFVMDWLEELGASCLRLNGEDVDGDCGVSLRLSTAGAELVLDDGDGHGNGEDGVLPLDRIDAAWYRRWQSHQRHGATEMVDRRHGIEQQARIDLYRHLNIEGRKLSEMLYAHLSKVPWLNTPASASPNKLLVLERAAAAGLEIPATLVTTRRSEVEAFAAAHGELITKPIGEAHSFYLNGEYHSLHTQAVTAADIAAFPAVFPASLFQERLDKKYELRAFYLAGECHSMAIFSQRDPKTQLDFRNYNFAHPNRYVPYRLPAAAAASIDVLMRGLGLGTGSLDMVRTVDGRLVFLEVNPNGQFTMVSRPCNYHLERKVAETLIASATHGKA